MTIRKLLASAAMMACPLLVSAQYDINDGRWQITFDQSSKTLTYTQNGVALIKKAYVAMHNPDEQQLKSTDYTDVTLTEEAVNDEFGSGTKYTYTYSGLAGKDNIEQSIYIYPDRGYILVDATLVANGATTKTNYIAPIVSDLSSTTFLPSGGRNYIYIMPHDNDNWVSYNAQQWSTGQPATSCEVSAAYDVTSRNGLVVGSIEHDNWKSGVTITPNGSNRMRKIEVAAGVVNTMTNDVNQEYPERPSLYKHGSISGKRVSSPRYFLGFYDDWRTGLEDLGDATATLSPKLPWDKGTIFAWQSWGGMAQYVNYAGAVNVVDFFKQEMEPAGFHNENGVSYMILDSYWDNLSEDELKRFVNKCNANGQIPGIYFSPFSCWYGEEDAEKYNPSDKYSGGWQGEYTFADMSLRANGKLRKIASIALDPTHPGTIEYIRRKFELFKAWGFKYIKLDFLNNGTLEADSYYDKNVTTGMQAYTYGMKKILEFADGMFVDLSIAPVFPAMGHARRMTCDCWGELDNSMYCLNGLEMAWWLDRVYQYNDPDHLVLSRAKTDGEARIRYTCGAMTGTVLLGDNYSLEGSYLGNQAERDLAMRIATNADINAVAHLGRSFRPVEGGLLYSSNRYGKAFRVDNEFVLDTDDALYYAVLNYDKEADFTKTADFSRIGIDPGNVKSIKELWTGAEVQVNGNGFDVTVPKCDVCMYRIEKGTSGINSVTGGADDTGISIAYGNGSIAVKAAEAIASVQVYDMQGMLLGQFAFEKGVNEATVSMGFAPGIYVAKVCLESGRSATKKVIIGK